MKSVKHLVIGPFDMAQAIREIAAAVDDLQEQMATEKPKPRPKAKATEPVNEQE
jgi:Sec-independent protein translocase protein TatA